MAEWDELKIREFTVAKTGEIDGEWVEGPAYLGDYTVWRCWTRDPKEWHAHYVIATAGSEELLLQRDFQPFAYWLARAFNAKDTHARRLDWLRSIIAAIITLTLLGLVVWAVAVGEARNIDFKWLVGALAASAFAYLLGGWTRR